MSKKNLIRAILVDNDSAVTEIQIDENDISTIHSALSCHTFDVARVKWDQQDISIYIDDEGTFVSGNIGRNVATISDGRMAPNNELKLYGKLLVLGGTDSIGRTLPCPDEITVENIFNFVSQPVDKIS